MSANNPTNPEGKGKTVPPSATLDSHGQGPTPIFVSFIYDFVKADPALGGDGSGRPGTIGGPVGEQEPRFKVFTYQHTPLPAKNIEGT